MSLLDACATVNRVFYCKTVITALVYRLRCMFLSECTVRPTWSIALRMLRCGEADRASSKVRNVRGIPGGYTAIPGGGDGACGAKVEEVTTVAFWGNAQRTLQYMQLVYLVELTHDTPLQQAWLSRENFHSDDPA